MSDVVPMERFRELVKTNEKHYQDKCDLIIALRECVVSLDRCRKRLSIWDTQELALFAVISRAESTLERYGEK